MKILVHICCSVDSHFFLQKLQKKYPKATLIGFFYDPNIHPYSEYYLRYIDVKRSCQMLGIELIEGEYDYLNWLDIVRGLENEPEKGARCSVCFDRRFIVSAKKAKELGCGYYTSTLLTSPKKSIKQLKISGESFGANYNIEFLSPDFRQNNGTQEQNIIAKEAKLYRQNYCGCIYALKQQRQQQNRLLDELMCPINKQVLPASIEQRVNLYLKRIKLEEQNIDYKIAKFQILNWRLLSAKIIFKKDIISSHIVPMSMLKRGFSRGKIEYNINDIYYFNRDEIKFISLKIYNKILNTNYNSVSELYINAPSFESELALRKKIVNNSYDLSAIIVLDEVKEGKYEITINAKIFQDTQEQLIVI